MYFNSSPIHTDLSYAEPAIAFTVDRIIDETWEPPQQLQRVTRRSGKKLLPPLQYPADRGMNFVDVTLKVVVKSAPATLFTFKAHRPHGNTCGFGVTNWGMASTFSERLMKHWSMLKPEDRIIAGDIVVPISDGN